MVPFKWKRASFICHVVNASVSGIEAFVPSGSDYVQIDKVVASFGRLALRGKACAKDFDKGEFVALKNVEVLKNGVWCRAQWNAKLGDCSGIRT